MNTQPKPHRVLWRTARGTSVEQYAQHTDAREAFHAIVTGIPDAFHVTLWTRTDADWLLCDQWPQRT